PGGSPISSNATFRATCAGLRARTVWRWPPRKPLDTVGRMHMPSFLTRLLLVAAVALTLLGATTSEAFAQAPDAGNDPYEWKWAFPLLGDKVAERGIKVPLPWGIGVNYVFVDQPID